MSTQEDYIQSVYKVLHYIDEHYGDNLTLDELSAVAGFSKYHFHRIFKSVMQINVADHVRNIRLQNAVTKFKTDMNITQIALESGYETSSSFSKAFKKRFGTAPSGLAKRVNIKGKTMLTPKIVEMEPIDVLFVRKTGEYMSSADSAWKSMVEFITKHDLFEKVSVRYGISYDNPNVIEAQNLRYDACVEFNGNTPHNEGEVLHKTIAGGKYAVFTHKGDYSHLDESFRSVCDWIVANNVTLRDEPQVQKYLDLDPSVVQKEDLTTELYIPIV